MGGVLIHLHLHLSNKKKFRDLVGKDYVCMYVWHVCRYSYTIDG